MRSPPNLARDRKIFTRSCKRWLYFLRNLGGILNDDVILGQIFGRDGGSDEITKIFGWRFCWVGLNRVLDGTPATRLALVEFWRRSPTVDYHRR